MQPTLSIIIPAYNESELIATASERIVAVAEKTGAPYELIIVDDGSRDATWEQIRRVSEKNPLVKAIRFSRNFGKEQAVFAGLDHADGAAVVILDADLQHPPETIAEMYAIWREGQFDVVRAVKSSRGAEPRIYALLSRFFYRAMKSLSGLDLANASDFVLLDRKVVDALKTLPEHTPFLRGLVAWVGFRQTSVTFSVGRRTAGKTKWRRRTLIRYAVSNFLSFSSLPLKLVNVFAASFLVFAAILGALSLYNYIKHDAVEGFTTVIIVLLLIGSGIMVGLGIIGEYIAKIHDESKRRPRYVAMSKIRK